MSQTTYEPSSELKAFLRRVRGMNAEQTWKNRRTDLKDYETWCDDNDVDLVHAEPLDIEPFFFALAEEDYSASTIRSRYDSVKLFYDHLAAKTDLIEESPFENINRKDYSRFMKGTEKEKQTLEEITYVTPEEVEQLSDNVPNPQLRNQLLIKLAFQTGVREGELVSIRLDKIDREEQSIKIYAEKTDDYRTVFYRDGLETYLRQWIDGGYRASYKHAPESPYLFVSDYTPQLDKDRVNKIVKEAAEDAEIQEVMYEDKAGNKRHKITSHALRHGHAVESIKSGIDIKTVALHLGHTDKYGNANIEMTQKYLRLVNDDVKNAYQSFGTR